MEQLLPSAPPPPMPPPLVTRGTPFLHCAAGASIWYLALIAAYSAVVLNTSYGVSVLNAALVVGAMVYVPTTVLLWLCLLTKRVQPWVLIFLSLPVYAVVFVLMRGFFGALRVVYETLLG